MPRKTKHVTITEKGRDQNKVYVITEMPAWQAEKWAMRAILALAKSGVDIPADLVETGWAALAVAGFNALSGLDFADAEPLMDEMMGCVKIIRDPSNPLMEFPLMEEDTEEVMTRITLRKEWFELHAGFLRAGQKSHSISDPAATPTTSDTPTSSESTATSSRPTRRPSMNSRPSTRSRTHT